MRRGSIIKRLDVYANQAHFQELFIQLSDLPAQVKTLESLSTAIFSGTTPKAGGDAYVEPPEGVAFVRSGEIGTDGTVHPSHEIHIREAVHEGQMKRSQLRHGDVLIAIVGATIGAVGVYNSTEPANINQAIAAIRLRKQILPRFLAAYLSTSVGQQILDYLKRPVARANINLEEIGQILVPELSTVRQVELLQTLDSALESRKQKLAQADGLLNSLDGWLLEQLGLTPPHKDGRRVFGRRFADVSKAGRLDPSYHLPKHKKVEDSFEKSLFPIRTLQVVCEPPVGGATPKKGGAGLYSDEGNGVRFLRILNVKPNELDLNDVNYVSQAVHNGELARSQLAENDVLMTITGRVGTAAVVTDSVLPANINQHIVRLRVKDDECLPDYLSAYLNSSVGLDISNRNVTGGTRIALDYEAIRTLPIPIPPEEVQQSIIAEVHRRRNDARRLRAEAETEWEVAKQRFENQLVGGE